MTLNYAHISYQKLGKRLGAKFLYYEVFTQPIIVINDVRVAQELLQRRSAIYSSRPQMTTLSKGIGIDKFFGLMPYGDEWRAQRGMFQQYFGPSHVEQQLEMHERMLRFVRKGLLPNILTSPQDFIEHLRGCISGFSISITYGLPVQRQHDPRVELAGKVFRERDASETSMTALSTFLLSMLKNRDVQREVQRELDSVIGSEQMPTMSDLPRLPYLSAVIKETLRWNPVAPLSVPRMTTTEDVYDGYYIPKGAIVLTNIYAMLHDEDAYPEPEEFKPERFIKNGALRDDVPDPEAIATFGFGRRICPGPHIALPFIHLIAASILSLFDILPEVDADGNPINVVPKFAPSSVTSEPFPFPCKIVPRGDRNVKELLKEYLDNEPI
ncbi:hypothetical protein Agabi119p4_8953 [Agaricus bisporus var. burnettii]|uniref:Cytochrome P450 n=1 Tax=Agaricus bisporus var. burnettii TaxID=192524 RepID=A0A8H7C5I1_AGABI|nr:hypothetical protein Agabi119p4_8953 [Agaricus bisporus var. burnettii]